MGKMVNFQQLKVMIYDIVSMVVFTIEEIKSSHHHHETHHVIKHCVKSSRQAVLFVPKHHIIINEGGGVLGFWGKFLLLEGCYS